MLFHRKDLVILTYESKCISYEITNAPRGCALARKEDVANATALGARVSQAKLFVLLVIFHQPYAFHSIAHFSNHTVSWINPHESPGD